MGSPLRAIYIVVMTATSAASPLTPPATTPHGPNVPGRPDGTSAATRLPSIDIVRGAVMVLMALDHVRDYVTNARFRPEDLTQSTPALFATRWVTHFCAPAFFLLAGLGVGIQLLRGKDKGEVSRFLVTRGLWLLVLELIITPIGWRFNFTLLPAFAVVLWALGLSMIVMAAVIHLPDVVVGVASLMVIAGHNLLDGVSPASLGAFGPVWSVLHVPGFVIPGKLLIAYPLIPWVAVMALGSVIARAYGWDTRRRRRTLIISGATAFAIFLVLRGMNGYGNAGPWSTQRTAALTVASFFNVQKYPPSLLFLLMTLGPALIALALTENAHGRVARWLSVYGRVPMFYYVVHIFVAHAIGVALALAQGGHLERIAAVDDPGSIPAWYGVSLPGVYVAWSTVVLLMYWPCRWFAELKRTRDDWWLRYL
jgi:uncharacterized membrane protein